MRGRRFDVHHATAEANRQPVANPVATISIANAPARMTVCAAISNLDTRASRRLARPPDTDRFAKTMPPVHDPRVIAHAQCAGTQMFPTQWPCIHTTGRGAGAT
jgi:hypothetical protein